MKSTVLPTISIPMQRVGINAVKQRGGCLIRCSSSITDHIASKNQNAQDLVEKYIAQAEERNGALNSFISIDREGAMQQVRTTVVY